MRKEGRAGAAGAASSYRKEDGGQNRKEATMPTTLLSTRKKF